MLQDTPTQNRVKQLDIVIKAIEKELEELNVKLEDQPDNILIKTDIKMYVSMLVEYKNLRYKTSK